MAYREDNLVRQAYFQQERKKFFLLVQGFLFLQFSVLIAAAFWWTSDRSHLEVALAVALMLSALACITGCFIFARAREAAQLVQREIERTNNATGQIEELFAMTDMLQAADDHDDAATVLMTTGTRLLPTFGASLYLFNNSRDRLDLKRSWNLVDDATLPETLHPNNCWALKRGKPHINDPGSKTLCCSHHSLPWGSVEIPMMARGSVHGLLILHCFAEDSFDQLMAVRRLGRALADSMSLALSNISLREKLRTQSLRDPLTGLYNRRYMEDALERFISLGARNGSSTAVLMIDLDNFKSLNDEHGHAKGDAVLRDVAAQIIGSLRPSDVVCRYGGEELLAVLPDCSLESALECAEKLRGRIESLSDTHQCRVSASIGVASIPETSSSAADVMPMADAALYNAKKAGKNCVRSVERRAERAETRPRLAKTG